MFPLPDPARDLLEKWASGLQPTAADCDSLIALELADRDRARAFGIDASNCGDRLRARARAFAADLNAVKPLIEQLGLPLERVLDYLWWVWLPLVERIASERVQFGRPLVWGILGLQGTGKTTLAILCRALLARRGKRALGLSIDDLYKTYAERQQLQQADPRLVYRGPPGTHDIPLGIDLLDRIRAGAKPLTVTRFDKSACNGAGDRATPERVFEAIDILLFEGWFVGVPPLPENTFTNPSLPLPIVSPADRQFARDTNARLRDYLPLWQRLDRLLVLYPQDYRLSKRWRREAEAQRIATGGAGMNPDAVDRFVDYFWRALHPELFVAPLLKTPSIADLVVEVLPDRSPGRVYSPKGSCGSRSRSETVSTGLTVTEVSPPSDRKFE
ncbi:putative kinase [Rubidibacter lacunae KORDI 51-2]|uniref:Putative kinase n=1 Tax=Rubidibacter lacunae KORDI 51-2 TaxID=582515 RepID=U5DPZ0_9CHRO|nr:putative kinase [Rubidibacter lacunae]ERN42669.1 putative kinase [Rubidibacter lacunae KORDI 51-2]